MKTKALIIAASLSAIFIGNVIAADKYEIDLAHSYAGFSVRHLVISNTKGSFTDFSGMIKYDEEDIRNSTAEVMIRTASIDTDNEDRDKHLKSTDFFDVEKFPEISFKSTKVEKTEDGNILHGNLTMRGVTKEIAIPFEILGKAKDPWGNDRIAFEGHTKLDRKDFGITWNKTMDAGGLVVGNEVKIELQVEAVKK
jgi:polyisoprenoid-binding protein YceI